jgi:hypothetical protein
MFGSLEDRAIVSAETEAICLTEEVNIMKLDYEAIPSSN